MEDFFDTKYCLTLCIIVIIAAGCSQHHEQTVTTETLHKSLKPMPSPDIYAGYNPKLDAFYIGNRFVQRNMTLDQENGVFATTAFIDKRTNTNWIGSQASQRHALINEFRFRIGKISFTGRNGKLKYKSYDIQSYSWVSKELVVTFEYQDEDLPVFDLAVHYEVDRDTPVLRKWLEFKNLTDRTFSIEELEIESIELSPELDATDVQIYPDNDMLVIAYASSINSGLVLSSNISGALKSYRIEDNKISLGLPPNSSQWRSEINVLPGEKKATPRVFIMPFGNGLDGTWRSTWLEFVRRYFYISSKDTASTVTFISPEDKISDEDECDGLICVDWAMGKIEFDRLVELAKEVRESQQKFGVRVDLTAVDAKIRTQADWQFQKHNGEKWLSSDDDKEVKHFCLASEYVFYATDYLLYLVDEVKPDYLVFDGSVFGPDEKNIGCVSFQHEHSGPADSIILIYQSLFNVADLLHRSYPDLAIAITPEAYATNLPDYGLISSIDQFVFDQEKADVELDRITKIFPEKSIIKKIDGGQ